MVGINVPIPVPVAWHSFGGWKASLFGDAPVYGPEGIRFYTRPKVVTVALARSGVERDRPRLPDQPLTTPGRWSVRGGSPGGSPPERVDDESMAHAIASVASSAPRPQWTTSRSNEGTFQSTSSRPAAMLRSTSVQSFVTAGCGRPRRGARRVATGPRRRTSGRRRPPVAPRTTPGPRTRVRRRRRDRRGRPLRTRRRLPARGGA